MKLILQIGFVLILLTNANKVFSTPEMPPEVEQIREIPNETFCWVATREVKENGQNVKKWENFDFDIIEFFKKEALLRGLDCGVLD
tara:strand:- start:406 stop:663 length:258 start_codon:yes stop_codon:yes gene_type:complete